MDIRQEKKDDMAKDMLETMHHERCMVENTEYFTEWTIENFYFPKQIFLFDVIDSLNKHCAEYGQSVSDLLDEMKEI